MDFIDSDFSSAREPGMGINYTFMKATSSDIDPHGKAFVVIYWKPAKDVIGYNLYCSRVRGGPINGNDPISSVKTCEQLKSIISEGSPEWEILSNAFTYLEERARSKDDFNIKGSRPLSPSIQHKMWRLKHYSIDPCAALARGFTAEEKDLLNKLANINLKIRLLRGLGYVDPNVKVGKEYVYELRGVRSDATEVVLAKNVKVVVGESDLPQPPSKLELKAGDRKVLATWNRNDYVISYMIRRSTTPDDLDSWKIINNEPIFYDIEYDLHGNPIDKTPGFLDFQRWCERGWPTSYEVDGNEIEGPENGVTYCYQVASCDILGRIGDWSKYQSIKPIVLTPPMTPIDLKVDPWMDGSTIPPQIGLALSWSRVTKNIDNHQILGTNLTYKIYRSDKREGLEDYQEDKRDKLEELASVLSSHITPIGEIVDDPAKERDMTLYWKDADTALVPPYGEKDFWYRIQCVDDYGHPSAPSAILSGRVPDIRPPGPTEILKAEGHPDHITIYWRQNREPDLAGYQIYRSICHKGEHVVSSYTNVGGPENDGLKLKANCDFEPIREISLKETEARIAEMEKRYHNDDSLSHAIYYADDSVPKGSPLCYLYWVRAFDIAGNLYSGIGGCPANKDEYICQRLYEDTPPAVPIITGLKSGNNSVEIEWIASPVQDLRAFHVYRSETEYGSPEFRGCILTDGKEWLDSKGLPRKWTGIKPKCVDIPAMMNPEMASGSFKDENIENNRVYWYRVSALDWLANESRGDDIASIPAVSTFTYSKDLPIAPKVNLQEQLAVKAGGMMIQWGSSMDPSKIKGFLVFRSLSEAGPYRQVSPLTSANSFLDLSALQGKDYWYCVQVMDDFGRLSKLSNAVQHRY